MNQATANLEDDHVNILQLIEIMGVMTSKTEPNIAHLEEAVDLIKNYADGMHHAKEENLLFPKLGEHGFSNSQGPVGMMLQEHTLGREYVRGITDALTQLKEGDLSGISLAYLNMYRYGELLEQHIYKENNMLFRMADEALNDQEQESLFIKFQNIENQGVNGQSKNDFIDRINSLRIAYIPS